MSGGVGDIVGILAPVVGDDFVGMDVGVLTSDVGDDLLFVSFVCGVVGEEGDC